ncbi:MAG: ABC transporter substrate-binding protein [Alphaproteobacteria bacterium]|nr:ABC transporter substrate-binding protein [Alphaproteobacteria bacterium]MBT5390234.1 ABC transporter substrate-binding protein [Alphaproteobacteria bacterium]
MNNYRAGLSRVENALFFFLLFSMTQMATISLSWAQQTHGISVYKDLKYPANFTHFDFVNPDATKGGEIRLSAVGTFDTVHWTTIGILPLNYFITIDTLLAMSLEEPFSMYGLIAEAVELAPDRSWVEYTINPKAQWHDGTPITVEDVIFTWKTKKEKGRANMRICYNKVEKVEKMGHNKVRFTFKKTDGDYDPEMPLLMSFMGIIPEKYWKDRKYDEMTLTPPPACGAYKISKFEPGRYIIYERVKDYWARNLPTRKGIYNFDRVRVDYFRDDAAAIEAFKSGLVDFRMESNISHWENAYVGPNFASGKIKKVEKEHKRPVGITGFAFNTRKDIFKDKLVREALSFAFDFENLNKNIYGNVFVRHKSYFENSDLVHQGKSTLQELVLLEPFRNSLPSDVFEGGYSPPKTDGSGENRKNIRKALTLLKGAGWTIKKGILINEKTGKPFEFEILLNSPKHEKIALAYKRNLAPLGIKVNVRNVDSAQYQKLVLDRDYDMIYAFWPHSRVPKNILNYFWTTKAANEFGSKNFAGVRNKVVDYLVSKAILAQSYKDEIVAARALDRVLLANHYIIPLFYSPIDRAAYWDKFGQPKYDPIIGVNTNTWWVRDTNK